MSTPPAGWYPDPIDARRRRWFDGTTWSPMVGYPGAQRPVFEPADRELPLPAPAVELGAEQPDDDSDGDTETVKRPKWQVALGAVLAVAVAGFVGLAVTRGSTGDVAPPVADPCVAVEKIVSQRSLQQILRTDSDLLVLVTPRDTPSSDEVAGSGDAWPDDGRELFDSRILGAVAPQQWALRRWDDGVVVLLQRFETPAEAARWDRAGLVAACRLDGHTVELSPAGPGAAEIVRTLETGGSFVQVSGLRGQYRAVVWQYAPEGTTVDVGRVAAEQLRHLSASL